MLKKIFGVTSLIGVLACLLEFIYIFYKQQMFSNRYFIASIVVLAITVILAVIVGNLDSSKENTKKVLMVFVLGFIGLYAALFLMLFITTAVNSKILGYTTIGTIFLIGVTVALCVR